jgi:hypothetical protein
MPEEMTMARGETLPPVNQANGRDDELPDLGPVSPHALAIHTTASGACDIRIPLHTALQLADPAMAAIRTAQEMGSAVIKLEAKSKALCNITVPVIAAATITLIWLLRGRSLVQRQ